MHTSRYRAVMLCYAVLIILYYYAILRTTPRCEAPLRFTPGVALR